MAEEAEKKTEKSIFRQKSLDKVSSPEELNNYIRVTNPSIWVVLLALVLLLIGMLSWSILGTVETHGEDGTVEAVHPIEFVVN